MVDVSAEFFGGVEIERGGQTPVGQGLMLVVGAVCERVDGDAAARGEDAAHLDVAGLHKLPEVVEDDVHAVFMEVAVVAEREEVELEALALDHALARYVVYDDAREIGLPGLGAERGEFGTVEGDDVIAAGVFVVECLEHAGGVVGGVGRGARSEERAPGKFVGRSHCGG